MNQQDEIAAVLATDSYDWAEAFGYAGDPESSYGHAQIEAAAPGMNVSTAPFGRADVAVIHGAVAGEHDGPPWVCWGELKDGRWFALKAGCDYTGWD